MKKKSIAFFEYLFIFFGFAAMYFFTVPDTDVIVFSRDYENTVYSIFHNALYYGNGRILGNIIGFVFSMNYSYAFLLFAVIFTAIVALMNRFFFDGDYRTIMPVAFAIAFPCSGYISEVYLGLPSFVNYVVPFVFIFSVLLLIKYGNKSEKKFFYHILIFILSVGACLFSENTTVFIIVLSVLCTVYSYLNRKKTDSLSVSFIAGSCIGGLIMFLTPKILETSDKLDSYRQKADSLSAVVSSALAAFSTFADIFSRLVIPLFIISAVFILLLKKESTANKPLKDLVCIVLAFFPIEAFFYTMLSQYGPASTYFFTFQTGLVIIYAVALFIAILCLDKSLFKQLNICMYVLTLSSFGPVLFAYLYGWRTFYIPCIVLTSYAIILFKRALPYVADDVKTRLKSVKLNNAVVFILSVCFLCLSFTVFIQSVYNYNFYVTRTQIISENLSEDDNNENEIRIPVLPCRGISGEDESGSISWLLYKTGRKDSLTVSERIYCNDSLKYYDVLNSNPVSATVTAFKSLDFKKDGYVFDLLSK